MNSSVLRWPDKATVIPALEDWVRVQVGLRPEVLAIGYFGSYARGDWGVGSDLDIIIITDHSTKAFESRAAEWNTTQLPVPAETVVYTEDEWLRLPSGRFRDTLAREVIWLFGNPHGLYRRLHEKTDVRKKRDEAR